MKEWEKKQAEEVAAHRKEWKTQYTQATKMIKALRGKLSNDWKIEELDASKMHGYYSRWPDLTVLYIDTGEDVKFEVRFNAHKGRKWKSKSNRPVKQLTYTGTCEFETVKGAFTFDRTGVENSIETPWDDNPSAEDLEEQILDLMVRAEQRREAHTDMESIPGIPFMVSPKSKVEIAKKLNGGGFHRFHPSGFGTGYTITCRSPKRRDPWGPKKAKKETQDFFGVKNTIWIQTFDAD